MITRTDFQRFRAWIAAVLILPASVMAAEPTAVRYYEDAVSRFNKGDVKGAEIQLKNAMNRDPGQLAARILMGRIQLELGNAQQAEEELERANKLGADGTVTALPLARARNRLGKYKLNVEQLVPTEIPLYERADAWVELGIARLKSGDPDGAGDAFQQAITVEPLHAGGMVGKVRIQLESREYAAAERLADEVIANHPDNADAWFTKALAVHARGDNENAVAAYSRAADLDPGNTAAALGEATALLDSGQADTAAALLAALRERHPWIVEAAYLHANALRELGEDEQAQAALAAAAEILDPIPAADLAANPALLRLAGLLAAQSHRLERAYQTISLYLQARPEDLAARKLFARIALAMDKPDIVRRTLVPLVTDRKADAEVLGLLGDASAQTHDYITAESYYRDALANYRGGPALMGRLGALQYRQGQREQALRTLQSATEQEHAAPTIGVSLYTAVLNYAEGRLDEAREITDQVLSHQHENLVALNLRAALAIASGDREEGRQRLKSLLEKTPDFRPAQYNLAKLNVLDGRYREAEGVLNRLLAKNPNDLRALQELGRLEASRNNNREAIQHYEKIREINPRALVPITELIELYIAESRLNDAMRAATALNRELLDNFFAHTTLAAVQLVREEYHDARSTLNKGFLLAGYDPRRLMRTATLQYAAKAYDDAITTLTKLLDERPQAHAARRLLAEVLFDEGRVAQAKQQVEKILAQHPDDILTLALLGDIQLIENQPESAAITFARAIAIDPQPELIVSLFRARARSGDGDAALEELKTWQSEHQDTPIVLRALAERHHQLGELSAALDFYRRLVAMTPDDGRSLNNMANLLMESDTEQAFQTARRALAQDPDNPAILDTMGWSMIQIGELEAGIAHLRDAVARDGQSAVSRYHLGAALEEYGSYSEAKRQLRQALRLGGDNAPWANDAQIRLQRLN